MRTRTLAYTYKMPRTLRRQMTTALTVALLSAMAGGASRASFLDILALTPGTGSPATTGVFNGTLGASVVNGAITTPDPQFNFTTPVPTTGFFDDTTINNLSAQYSYGSIYTPSAAAADRVGYDLFGGAHTSAIITINFSPAVMNPVFHVANLDSMQYDFSLTTGFSGSPVYLSGNGGLMDGLQVVGNVVSDANTSTVVGVSPAVAPPTTGPRSAYGSVSLPGTFSSLVIMVSNPSGGGDGGSFTLSESQAAVPEPGSVALLVGMATVDVSVLRRKRRR